MNTTDILIKHFELRLYQTRMSQVSVDISLKLGFRLPKIIFTFLNTFNQMRQTLIISKATVYFQVEKCVARWYVPFQKIERHC